MLKMQLLRLCSRKITGYGEHIDGETEKKSAPVLAQPLVSKFSEKRSRDFFDLPAEIRLRIYEFVFPQASVALQYGEHPAMIAVVQSFPQLISRGSRDVQLLRTCRSCCDEASSIFYGSLNLLVYQHLHLLRTSFLSRIGPLNASYIRRAVISPIGLPGEHQRFLECLGARNGGLVGLDDLTLEIWDTDHIADFVSTCKELIRRHHKLKVIFGRGMKQDERQQVGDIPTKLRLAPPGKTPGYRVWPES